MTYGLTCINTSSELTLSSDGMLFGYIGKATFVSATQASGDAVGSQAGYCTYTVSWPGQILCAIGLKSTSVGVCITNVIRTNSTTWTIFVNNPKSPAYVPNPGAGSFWTQGTDAEVFCWGVPTSVSGYGIAMYNSSGVLSGDLSRSPLQFRQRSAIASGTSSITIPSLTKPLIMGNPASGHGFVNNTGVGGTPWHITRYEGVWAWNGTTTVTRGDVLSEDYNDDGPGGATNYTYSGVTQALIIEGSGLT